MGISTDAASNAEPNDENQNVEVSLSIDLLCDKPEVLLQYSTGVPDVIFYDFTPAVCTPALEIGRALNVIFKITIKPLVNLLLLLLQIITFKLLSLVIKLFWFKLSLFYSLFTKFLFLNFF